MQADSAQTVLEATTTRSNGYLRLAVGLLQGGLLYLLYRANSANAWPATEPFLFVPLLMAGVLLPVLLISSLGHIGGRTLVLWMAAAAAVIAVLALHDVWRMEGTRIAATAAAASSASAREARYPSALVTVFSAAFFFIAHSLVMAAVQEGRRLASYATYFETAWKLFIQAAFSALFVGALWAMLNLGAGLFQLVKLGFLRRMLLEAWFNMPVLFFAFACAMHITDVRPAIVRGIRTLLLVLMSWLLPVTVLLLAGFLGSLPFTGLEALWKTGHATSALLGAAAALVVLINAAYQNGEVEGTVARAVRWSARIGALLLLLPLVAIAVYALSLRVGDYGWSSDRLIAAACMVVAACYALGYAYAALQRGAWLRTLSMTNVGAAWLVLAVLLALFTPIADPARISVNSQLARLERGAVKADKFDYEYLKFEGARYGRAALERLKMAAGPDAALKRAGAVAALAKEHRSWRLPSEPVAVDISANLAVWPQGSRLPEGFPLRSWTERGEDGGPALRCLREAGVHCDAFMLDLTGDGKPEVVLIGADLSVGSAVAGERDGKWQQVASLPYSLAGCAPLLARLKAGEARAVAKPLLDIEVDGQRVSVEPLRLRVPLCC